MTALHYTKTDIVLAIGDRLVLWALVVGLAGVVGWMAVDAERNSPTLISPACVTTVSAPHPKATK